MVFKTRLMNIDLDSLFVSKATKKFVIKKIKVPLKSCHSKIRINEFLHTKVFPYRGIERLSHSLRIYTKSWGLNSLAKIYIE